MIQDRFIKYYDYRPFSNLLLNKITGNSTKIFEKLANAYLPGYFRRCPLSIKILNNKPHTNAIVSMTSFPQRISNVWLVVECLLRQTVLPKKIVLYLSTEQFLTKYTPVNLLKYINEGLLLIRWVDGDIRSHKKYWYAVSEFPNSPIITVDDDIIYPSTFIESLIKNAKQHSGCVVCSYWHPMQWNTDGSIKPYSSWVSLRLNKGNFITGDVFFGSGGGTYFPYGSLSGADVDTNILKACCPTADDIWLNAIVRKNGFKIYCLPYKYSVPEWKIRGNKTLASVNNGMNKNDEQLIKVQEVCLKLFGVNPFNQKF